MISTHVLFHTRLTFLLHQVGKKFIKLLTVPYDINPRSFSYQINFLITPSREEIHKIINSAMMPNRIYTNLSITLVPNLQNRGILVNNGMCVLWYTRWD